MFCWCNNSWFASINQMLSGQICFLKIHHLHTHTHTHLTNINYAFSYRLVYCIYVTIAIFILISAIFSAASVPALLRYRHHSSPAMSVMISCNALVRMVAVTPVVLLLLSFFIPIFSIEMNGGTFNYCDVTRSASCTLGTPMVAGIAGYFSRAIKLTYCIWLRIRDFPEP